MDKTTINDILANDQKHTETKKENKEVVKEGGSKEPLNTLELFKKQLKEKPATKPFSANMNQNTTTQFISLNSSIKNSKLVINNKIDYSSKIQLI